MNDASEQKILLHGFALIEASAGTGKTYTIQNLYLRMIAGWYDETSQQERHLSPEEILVMTYTIAATEELKDRIRKILTQGQLYFENPAVLEKADFERLDELLKDARSLLLPEQTQDDRDRQIRNRIRNALLIFDDAAIFTIHGFCQRLLSQYAFESGILFNAEIRTDGDRLIQGLLDDYLRAYSYPEKGPLYAALRKGPVKQLADAWQRTLTKELMTRPDLQILGAAKPTPADLERKIEAVLKALQSEYRPGLIGEMRSPGADQTDSQLLKWKKTDDVTATDEEILDIFSHLHEDFHAHADPAEPPGRFAVLCAELAEVREQYQSAVSMDAAQWTKDQFARMKERENFLTFDDLLNGVLHALREKSNPLLKMVRKQYRAAIVDEFQDTDPVQYEIFRRIFGEAETGHILFLVGDPKQAIYGFRGGDTATYRVARNFVQCHGREYVLECNFRSTEKLLNAVNDLFEKCPREPFGKESVFADPAVHFQAVSIGKKGPGLVDSQGNEDSKPFKLRWLTVSDPNASSACSLTDTLDRACRVCAEDVVALLNSDWRLPDTGKRLQPNDIAVLVPDNTDAKRIREELKKRNVPSVIPKSENVFKSVAAKELKTVLKAVASPSDAGLVSEAMLTPLLGFSLDDMIGIHAAVSRSGAGGPLSDIQEKMLRLGTIWHQNSFLKMFQELLRCFDVRAKLLKRPDGERILTDLLHLRELIHQKVAESGLSVSGVLSFLAAQETEADSEEKETMMETDRSAVVISTIHSSKGLEYPVVMLPLMFKKTFSFASGRIACYHDVQGRLTLNLSPDSDAEKWIELEKKQELMRLLYVALTRAQYSCFLYWGLISAKTSDGLYNQTAVDWLLPELSGHDLRNLNGFPPQLENCDIQLIPADLLSCSLCHPEAVRQEGLFLREWHGKIDPDYHFISFSALTDGPGGSDEMDYDFDDSGNRVEKPVGIFRIPAGAQTGNAWHDIMEEIDFTAFDPEKDRDFIEQQMEIFGVLHKHMKPETREEYVSLTGQMIRRMLSAPLRNAEGEQFFLREIPRSERLSELKFNYRFHQPVRTGELTSALSEYVQSVFGAEKSRIFIRDLNVSGGYLNGAVDLLFRRNGKLYIADWKSNRIDGHSAGFSSSGVLAEMAAHTYYLQYLIYTVAVMKYLSLHLGHPVAEPEYERLFGGVYYFFMRGMDPAQPGQGIFFTRPPFDLIRKLENLIG